MRVEYFEDTDTLQIMFSDRTVAETRALDERTLVELDADGWPVALTLEHAQSDLSASAESPEEVLELRPSPSLAARISALLEKNRREGLTPDEEQEWERYEYLEHLLRIAKAKAMASLKDRERAFEAGAMEAIESEGVQSLLARVAAKHGGRESSEGE